MTSPSLSASTSASASAASCSSVTRLCRQQSLPKYPPALLCTSHIVAPPYSSMGPPPKPDLVECTSHIATPASAQVLDILRKKKKKRNRFNLPSPLAISRSHSDTHSHTQAADRQEREIKATPPAPALRTAPSEVDTLGSEGEMAAHALRRPCSTRRQPRGRRERPLRPRLAAHSPGPLSQSGFPRSPCISIRNPKILFQKLQQRKEFFSSTVSSA